MNRSKRMGVRMEVRSLDLEDQIASFMVYKGRFGLFLAWHF